LVREHTSKRTNELNWDWAMSERSKQPKKEHTYIDTFYIIKEHKYGDIFYIIIKKRTHIQRFILHD
jgi:hypothetical protein